MLSTSAAVNTRSPGWSRVLVMIGWMIPPLWKVGGGGGGTCGKARRSHAVHMIGDGA